MLAESAGTVWSGLVRSGKACERKRGSGRSKARRQGKREGKRQERQGKARPGQARQAKGPLLSSLLSSAMARGSWVRCEDHSPLYLAVQLLQHSTRNATDDLLLPIARSERGAKPQSWSTSMRAKRVVGGGVRILCLSILNPERHANKQTNGAAAQAGKDQSRQSCIHSIRASISPRQPKKLPEVER